MSQWEIGTDRLNSTCAFTAGCCPTQAQAHTGQVKSEFYYPWFQDTANFLGVGWVGCIKVEFRKSYNFRHNALWVLLRYENMSFQNDFHTAIIRLVYYFVSSKPFYLLILLESY